MREKQISSGCFLLCWWWKGGGLLCGEIFVFLSGCGFFLGKGSCRELEELLNG